MDRLDRFVRRNEPGPLSGLWAAYVYAIWQPTCQVFLDTNQREGVQELKAKNSITEISRRGAKSHPFNFSDDEVNAHRADKFLFLLKVLRTSAGGRVVAKPAWWPQDPAGIVAIVKREREEMDALGYLVGRGEEKVAHAGSAGALGEGESANTSALPTVKRKRSDSMSAAP